jgi:hypothetical protein
MYKKIITIIIIPWVDMGGPTTGPLPWTFLA